VYRLIKAFSIIGLWAFGVASYAGQDPMRPPNFSGRTEVSAIEREPIELQQILISKDRTVVIINNKILQEGQTVAGARIIEIEASQVSIVRSGVKKVLKLLPVTKEVNREI
jgi:hypothetical protein